MHVFPYLWGSKFSSSSRAAKVLSFGAWRQDLVMLHEAWKKLWLEKGDWKGSLSSSPQQSSELSSDFTGCEWGSGCLSLLSHSLKLRLLLGYGFSWCHGGARNLRVGAATHSLPLSEGAKGLTISLHTESVFCIFCIMTFTVTFFEIAGNISQLNTYPPYWWP